MLKEPAGTVTRSPYSLVSMEPSPVVSNTEKIRFSSSSDTFAVASGGGKEDGEEGRGNYNQDLATCSSVFLTATR